MINDSSENINEMFERILNEHKEKRKLSEVIRREKLDKIPKEMLEQIAKEVQSFESIEAPTGQQCFEQAIKLATLMSYYSPQVIDVKVRTVPSIVINDDGSKKAETVGEIKVWLDTATVLILEMMELWVMLNALAEQAIIAVVKNAYGGNDVISVTFVIADIEQE